MLTLSFLIYSYHPYGGQQRDFLRVVEQCVQRGHQVNVYTMKWQGEQPKGVNITVLPVSALFNHTLYRRFTALAQKALAKNPADVVVGFNKMPGLDVYFAADPCFAERALNHRASYYRFTPRFRHFMDYENAVFGARSKTRALILSPLQRQQFSKHYPGCEARLYDLPPGINKDRRAPANAAQIREQLRQEFALSEQDHLVLHVGSGFVVKGVDRSLRAIASLPADILARTTYMVVGQDKPARFKSMAFSLGINDRVMFLGGRDDVPRFLLAADLLLHPAYSESAGYVLLEATVAGLPVLTTDTCGYAFHIEQAESGEVCTSPFDQQNLNQRLLKMLISPQRQQWSENGLHYADTADLYSMPETAASLIEQFAAEGAGDAVSA